MYEERWQAESLSRETGADPAAISAAVNTGRKAVIELHEVMEKRFQVPKPASYLAVIAQDIDDMGRFLGGIAESPSGAKIEVSAASHRQISAALQETATEQRGVLETTELLGVPVYSGGDDLLAFTPARSALAAAKDCHAKIPPGLTASTAVLFFHYHAGLQSTLTKARHLLEDAKKRVDGKHGLAVGYLRRSGVSEVSIQPWPGPDGGSTADLFGVFATGIEQPLSPRLLADLERDHAELARLSRKHPDHYRAELTRLVRRHIGKGESGGEAAVRAAAEALTWLGEHEKAPTPHVHDIPGPELAARVGVFLRQEAR